MCGYAWSLSDIITVTRPCYQHVPVPDYAANLHAMAAAVQGLAPLPAGRGSSGSSGAPRARQVLLVAPPPLVDRMWHGRVAKLGQERNRTDATTRTCVWLTTVQLYAWRG